MVGRAEPQSSYFGVHAPQRNLETLGCMLHLPVSLLSRCRAIHLCILDKNEYSRGAPVHTMTLHIESIH